MPRRTGLTPYAAALVCAAVMGAGGCSVAAPAQTPVPTATLRTPPSQEPTPTAEPTATVDPAVAEAEAAVLAAYRTYWEVSAAALADPLAPLPQDFDRFIVDKARAGLAESLLWAEQNDVKMVGAPMISPSVESLVLEGEQAAHVVDCVDSTDWILTHRETGDPASSATNQNTRVTADAWATVYDGRWVIREVTLNREEPC